MSNKKIALDILGEAMIPSDLLTDSLGGNYGLDGFEDLQYGMGVLEGVEDPDLMEAPALPTGLIKGSEGMDLTAMLEGESLADLDWLDPTQLPDPDRLPKNPVNLAIPELEEAWGVNRRTDGVSIVAARDLERSRYERTLESDYVQAKKASVKQMMDVVSHAMRRSTAHQDIKVVVKEALDSMGDEQNRIASALERVKADHGLAGNVYVRASAFPGYETGKWSAFVKRHASRAQYLLVDPGTLRQASWIHDGRCSYTGKKVVTQIPWKEAFNHYAPILKLGGRKVASGNPAEALRQAFLSTPEKRVVEANFPIHRPPVQKMSSEEARKALANTKVDRTVYDESSKRVAKGMERIKKALKVGTRGALLSSLIRETFLEKDMRLAVKSLTPLLKQGALNESVTATQSYAGPEFRSHAMTRVANLGDSSVKVMSRTATSALRWIRRSMSEGFAGKNLTDLINLRFANEVLTEISEPLMELRASHEGGAGFMYVDAAAYASPTGVTGCEAGALKHRANQIPAVAQMDRCATCAMSRTRQDGTKKCAVYNKSLLEDTSGTEMASLRKANVRVANMGDAEQTAAMFASPENAYDPSEFGLRNSNLEDVAPDFPEHEKIASITFGGWDL